MSIESNIEARAIIPVLTPGFDETVKCEGYSLEIPAEAMAFAEEITRIGGRVLVVGGSVRDAVIAHENGGIGPKPKDCDLEVYGIQPEDILTVLREKFDAKVNMAGQDFEVIKWLVPGFKEPMDISLPRRDSKKVDEKGHRAFIVTGDPTMTIAEASIRRDLTINSMAYDPLTKILYDPNGGIADIKNKIIRVTDNITFIEDPVRVVRIMQFAARFEFQATPETLDLCTQIVENGDLDYVTRERIQEEFMKILTKGKKPSLAFEIGREIGFVGRYWPELYALVDLPQNPEWHPEGNVWNHEMQVVDAAAEIANREIEAGRMNKEDKAAYIAACLCHDLGKATTTEFFDGAWRSHGHEEAGVEPTKALLTRIFGKSQPELIAKVLPLVDQHLKPKEMWVNEVQKGINQGKALYRLTKRLAAGEATVYLLSLVAEADQRGRSANGEFYKREEVPELIDWQTWLTNKCEEKGVVPEKRPEEKVIKGAEILEKLGLKKGGPWVGIIISATEQDFFEGLIDKESLLKRALEYYDMLSEKVASEVIMTNRKEIEVLGNVLKLEDPRDYFK